MHFLVPHLLCILHKVDDNPGDSDDAEEGDADARDDEREHDREEKSNRNWAPAAFVLVGVLHSPGMHRRSSFHTSDLSHGELQLPFLK